MLGMMNDANHLQRTDPGASVVVFGKATTTMVANYRMKWNAASGASSGLGAFSIPVWITHYGRPLFRGIGPSNFLEPAVRRSGGQHGDIRPGKRNPDPPGES